MQAAFLASLPAVEGRARIAFRDVRCPQGRDDAVAEAVALAWSWFRRLVERGKDPTRFIGRLTRFACSHVRSGRRLSGQDRAADVLSPVARSRWGFAVVSLSCRNSLLGDDIDEALRDNTRSEIPEQVGFRLDFPRWRARHSARARRVIDALMRGERTGVVAGTVGVSASRVSQLRRELHDDWLVFHGESPAVASAPLA
jgi:hypothetical protein